MNIDFELGILEKSITRARIFLNRKLLLSAQPVRTLKFLNRDVRKLENAARAYAGRKKIHQVPAPQNRVPRVSVLFLDQFNNN